MSKALYTKCQRCHLFVEANYPPDVDAGAAPYVHLTRGDAHDEVIDGSHEAEPSEQTYSLDYWRTQGPMEMRLRFVYADIEKRHAAISVQSIFDNGVRMGLQEALDMLDTLR
jgi:hypothetical protein